MCRGVPIRIQPTLEGGRRMDQKQLARSNMATQGDADEEGQERRSAPICSKVGSRNLGGGEGQLEFKAFMLIMRAAFVELLRFTKASALGRPGCKATRPAARRESRMAWTKGQLDAFCGGVRASASRRPPGAEETQMSGGIGTEPTGPIPFAANAGVTGSWVRGEREVSEEWWSRRERAWV